MSYFRFPVLWPHLGGGAKPEQLGEIMSKEDNKFPVLHHYRREPGDGMPDFVRWDKLSEDQAYIAHGQTLDRLAERGGLSPRYILANIESKPFREIRSVPYATMRVKINDISI